MWLNPDTIDFVVSVRVCCDRTFVFVPCVGSMWWQVRRCLQTYTPVSLEVFLCKKNSPVRGLSPITASLVLPPVSPVRSIVPSVSIRSLTTVAPVATFPFPTLRPKSPQERERLFRPDQSGMNHLS